MKDNEYKCAICKNIYEYEWTREEANAEAKEIWGVEKASESKDMAIICDDCFNRRTPHEIKEMGDEFKQMNISN